MLVKPQHRMDRRARRHQQMIREPHIDIHFSLVHAGHAIMLFGGCIALLAFTCLPPVLFSFCIFSAGGLITSFGAWLATLESGGICTEPAGCVSNDGARWACWCRTRIEGSNGQI